MAEDPKNPFRGQFAPRGSEPGGGGVIKFRSHPRVKDARMRERAKAIAAQKNADVKKRLKEADKAANKAGFGPQSTETLRLKHTPTYMGTGKNANTRKGESGRSKGFAPNKATKATGMQDTMTQIKGRVKRVPANDNYKTGGRF